MKLDTTALVAEILVIGLQALVWVGLLSGTLLHLAGAPDVPWGDLADWVLPISLGLLAFAYTMGVMVDRVADSATDWLYEKQAQLRGKKSTRHKKEKRRTARLAGDSEAEFLEYQRGRLRIARATCFNLLLIWLTTLLVGLLGPGWVLVLALFQGCVLFPAAICSWIRITEAYEDELEKAASLIAE